jgi:hypothetical protein
VIHRSGKPDAAENQRYAGQHRHRGAGQAHEDQGGCDYIERDVRNRPPLITAAGDGAARIQ